MAPSSEPRPISTLIAPEQGLLRLLGGAVSAILWTTDRTLTITSLAGSGLTTLGSQPGTQRGQTLFEYLRTQDRQSPPIAAHLNALEGQAGDYEVDYRGRTFFSHVEPLRAEDGQVVGVVGLGLDMTDTLRTQRELKDSEERFRSIFDKAPLGIGIAYKGTLKYVNRALLDIFRYDDPADLLGKSVLAHIAPRCRDEIRRRIESRERGQPISDSFDTIGIRKDGSEFTYHLDIARIRLPEGDGSVAFVTDITDRVQAQEELRRAHEELEKRVELRTQELGQANRRLQGEVEERKRSESALLASEEKFRDLAENIKEVFWLVDARTGAMLYISPGYAEIWGRSCQSLYDRPLSWMESVHPEDRERVTRAQARLGMDLLDLEYRIVLPEGGIRWIHDRGFPVRDPAGTVYRFAGLAEDITDRKRLESEIHRAVEQSRKAYEDLQAAQSQLVRTEKLASIGMLVSGVAHEINNPLNIIYGNLKLLRELASPGSARSRRPRGGKTGLPSLFPEPRKIRQMIRDALRGAERARDIIETFRDFARDTRWAELVDLNDCLGKTVAVLRRQLPGSIQVVMKLRKIPKLHCFRGQMTQVFLNLIQNAIEAIDKNKKGKITLRSRRAGDHVLLEVEDTGRGMPPDVKRRVFEPFFTTKEIGQGLGLGLSVSAMIVQNHGGEIQVQSQIAKGTLFQIRLPVEKPSDSR